MENSPRKCGATPAINANEAEFDVREVKLRPYEQGKILELPAKQTLINLKLHVVGCRNESLEWFKPGYP